MGNMVEMRLKKLMNPRMMGFTSDTGGLGDQVEVNSRESGR